MGKRSWLSVLCPGDVARLLEWDPDLASVTVPACVEHNKRSNATAATAAVAAASALFWIGQQEWTYIYIYMCVHVVVVGRKLFQH